MSFVSTYKERLGAKEARQGEYGVSPWFTATAQDVEDEKVFLLAEGKEYQLWVRRSDGFTKPKPGQTQGNLIKAGDYWYASK